VAVETVMRRRIDVRIFPAFRGETSVSRLRLVVQTTLETVEQPTKASVSLVITDDATVQELNKSYRGLDETTDVLAFAFNHPGHYEGNDKPPNMLEDPFVTLASTDSFLGEVIVSYPQCERQAKTKKHSIEDELNLLVTHGVLHLVGYDHYTDNEERIMQELEMSTLTKLGNRRKTL
jgi:probable rRNA maturation factor